MLTLVEYAKAVSDPRAQLLAVGVAQAIEMGMPIMKILEFMPSMGMAYNSVWGTASTQKATRAVNTDFTAATPKPEQRNFPMRAAGGEQKLDRNMVDGDATGMVKSGLLSQKIEDVARRLFRQFFEGNATNTDEFDGLNVICTALSRFANHPTAAGGSITKKLMNAALAKVPGANLIMANTTLADEIDDLDTTKVSRSVVLNQGNPTPDMFARTYKGIPILAVGTAPNDTTGAEEEILGFDETQGASNDCSRITVARVSLRGLHGRQRKPMEITERGIQGSWDIVDLNWFMTPAVIDRPDCVWQIRGIKATA